MRARAKGRGREKEREHCGRIDLWSRTLARASAGRSESFNCPLVAVYIRVLYVYVCAYVYFPFFRRLRDYWYVYGKATGRPRGDARGASAIYIQKSRWKATDRARSRLMAFPLRICIRWRWPRANRAVVPRFSRTIVQCVYICIAL